MSKKTVVVGLPMLLRGGTEIQTLALVRILIKLECRVIVCCYYEYDAEMVEEFRKEGGEVVFLNLARTDGRTTFGQMARLFLNLRTFFRSASPSVVHVQYVAPGFIPIIAARWAGVKKVLATIHYPRHSLGTREAFLVRMAARFCDGFFCNSLATERSWFGSGILFDGKKKTEGLSHSTVYNAVDIEAVERAVQQVDKRVLKGKYGLSNVAVVGVVARLRSEKGHEFLLKAMKQVLSSAPRTKLIVVGAGPDATSLRQLADRLEIAESVAWSGGKSQREAFEFYGVMDVLVVPSIFEGFGLSAAEGMAAGLPVIASNIDGLQEVVLDGVTGILVQLDDVQGLASSILSILADTEEASRMGKRGRARVEEFFSVERFRRAIATVYELP